jgi:endoglucanase
MKIHHSSWLSYAVVLISALSGIQAGDPLPDSPLRHPTVPPLTEPYVAPTTPKYNYAEVLHKSFLFYHSQKSGVLPYQRLAWRSDSCKVCVGDFGEDLSRGWYEAANTMKWGLPLGWTVTQLAFNIMIFEDSMNSVDELAEGLELLKWGAGKMPFVLGTFFKLSRKFNSLFFFLD